MTKREAARLAEAIKVLRAGHGGCWEDVVSGQRFGPWSADVEQRAASVRLWLATWVLPALDDLAAKYGAAPAGEVDKRYTSMP